MKLRGSLILEASYIFPMTILFIIVIMIFAYYKHDRIMVRTSMRRHLMRNAYEEERRDFTLKDSEGVHYLTIEKMREEHGKNREKLSVKVNFEVLPKFLSLDSRLRAGEVVEEYKKYRPEVTARRYRMIFGE